VKNSEACVSKGATVQTPPWGSEPRQQPFTAPPEGRAQEAPCVLEPKMSSGLHHVSPPQPSGGLWRRHDFIMPRPICNYFYRIVLQFYVSFLHIYPSCDRLLFLCITSSSSCAILSQAGLLKVPATYLGSIGYFLTRGPVLSNGCSMEKIMLHGGVQSV
jgi:hypothetical protein